MTEATPNTTAAAPAPTKARRLIKNITEGNMLEITVIDGKKGKMTFDPKALKDAKVLAYLPALALNHRLGDAAAGRSGTDAEEAIQSVWQGLLKGELTVRAPASPKVSVNDITSGLAKLSPAEKAAAIAALKAIGINVPGV